MILAPIQQPIYSPIVGGIVRAGEYTSRFTPGSLFVGGVAGYTLPLNPAYMYQDSTGATPVTAFEQYIGKWLDASGNGNHYIQPTSTKRPLWTARRNLLLATATLSTQSVTVVAGNYVLAFAGAGSVALSGAASGTKTAGSNTITCTAGTLTLTVTGSVTSADLRTAADAALDIPPYQWVTTGAAGGYDTAGFPGFVSGDGVDDWMQSAAAVDLSGTAACTAVAAIGVKNTGVIFIETGANWSSIDGSFAVYISGALNVNSYLNPTDGNSYTASSESGVRNTVLSSAFNIAAATIAGETVQRQNGVSTVGSVGTPGTGNFISQTNYLLSRAGTSLFMSGAILSDLTVVGRTLTAAELAAAEAYAKAQARIVY